MNLIDGAEAAKHGAHTIGIRPEHIDIGMGPWSGTVVLSEHLGSDTFLKVDGGGLAPSPCVAAARLPPARRPITFGPQMAKIHRFGADGLAL
jgi:multiple sugar transport system ATP-binding protein